MKLFFSCLFISLLWGQFDPAYYGFGLDIGSSGSGFDYLDYGFSSVVGYSYQSFYTELCYDFGLNNIDSFNNSEARLMNRLFSLKVGYLIRLNKDKKNLK